MSRLSQLWSSSIGRKLVMAATGIALLGFLIGHLLGNLLVFQGPDALNAYLVNLQLEEQYRQQVLGQLQRSSGAGQTDRKDVT